MVYAFSVVPSTGFLQWKQVTSRKLTNMCCIAMSKCTRQSSHLVNQALFCLLHAFLLTGGSRALLLLSRSTFFRINKIGCFDPQTTANNYFFLNFFGVV